MAPFHTASEIARRLGPRFNRNMVIGALFRMGIRIGKPATIAPPPVTPAPVRSPAPAPASPRAAPPTSPARKAPPSPPATKPSVNVPQRYGRGPGPQVKPVAASPVPVLAPSPPPAGKRTSWTPLFTSSPIDINALKSGTCRWPLWDTPMPVKKSFYCGAACGDKTYCPDHHAIAYNRSSAPQKRGDAITGAAA
jgi:hypothetical protein